MRPRILPNRFIAGLAVLLALLIAGCSSGGGIVNTTGDFTMNFTGFTPHLGDTLYLKVVNTTTGAVAATMAPRVVTADAFTVSLPGIIDQGDTYRVDFAADDDRNGTIDRSPIGTPAGVDHTWRISNQAAANADLTINFVHDTNWTDITPF
jgi:hypothetical protein